MMSELFDEQRIRESYEMAEREHERIRLAEIRESAMAEGEAKGRAEGIIDALIGLVKDGLLPIAVASERAGMTIENFEKELTKQ